MTNFAVFLQSRNELLDKIRELIRQGYKMEGSELLTHLKKLMLLSASIRVGTRQAV